MATTVASPAGIETVADLLEQLGGIAPERIRFRPPPGTATVSDVVEIARRERRLCELVDGVLVEKPMGYRESVLASFLITALNSFVLARNLGFVSGEAGMMRLFAGLVRIPDVAFASWDRLPAGKIPEVAVPDLAPNLAVEILSTANTPGEMQRKRGEYFRAGVELVWIIDPDRRVATVFTAPDQSTELDEQGSLTGGSVLPGFTQPLRDLFAELDRAQPR